MSKENQGRRKRAGPTDFGADQKNYIIGTGRRSADFCTVRGGGQYEGFGPGSVHGLLAEIMEKDRENES